MRIRSLPSLLTLLLLTLPPLAESVEPAAAKPAEATTSESVASDSRKSSPTLQQWVQWLPPTLPAHEVEWLRDNTVFCLYFPQQTAKAKGAVLVVPAIGQHAAWPNHIRALSEQLPPNGWSVLIVTPIAQAEKPFAKPTVDAAAPKTDSVDTSAPSQPASAPESSGNEHTSDDTDMTAMLQAGITLLESKDQKNIIIIGFGDNGMDAVLLAHKNMGTGSSVKGLVLADMSALARPAQKLSEIFRLNPIQVLDIVHPQELDAQRLRAAQLKQFPQYYAVQLPEPMADIQQGNDRFARRVRGWLTRYVSGRQKSGPKPNAGAASPAQPASNAPAGQK